MPDIRPISNALAARARDELFEVSERLDDDIETIRTWIKKQPHLRSPVDDQFIVTFLRGCKYSLERTKQKIDMFHTLRSAFPEIFWKRDSTIETHLQMMRMGAAIPLPHTDGEDGPRIILLRPGSNDPNQIKIEDLMSFHAQVGGILMREDDNVVISGVIGVLDLSNVKMAHLLQFTPTLLKKLAIWLQEGSPFRQKGFHYINTPSSFETLFDIFKSFISEKNRKRLHVYGDNIESLFEHVPKKLLPMEYGGDAGPIQNIINEWEKKIISHAELFKSEAQYGCDESKRIGARKTQESLFGIDGSFRKLNID